MGGGILSPRLFVSRMSCQRCDPDGWPDNYLVAYWQEDGKDILLSIEVEFFSYKQLSTASQTSSEASTPRPISLRTEFSTSPVVTLKKTSPS